MYDKKAITSITTLIAGIVAVAVALVLPIGFFTVSYQYVVGSLETEAEITSRIVTDLINTNPDHWQYEQLRLEELLARRMQYRPKETRRILDLRNRVVAESVTELKPPLISRRFNLMDAGVTVGTLEVQSSLFQLLFQTILTGLFGVCCGLVIFITLRVLPLRAVAQAEKSLRESELRYRRLVDNAPDAILVYDHEMILYANSAAFLLFGTERQEQLLGQSIVSIIHPDFRELAREHFHLHDDEGLSGSHLDLRFIRFNGSPVDVAAVGISINYKGKPAIQVILHDITERKQFQNELADKVEQMEAALAKVKQLEGIIPICMYCKKIRDDKESWQHLESYITQHSEAHFSHGICPECFQKASREVLMEHDDTKF